MSGLLTIVFGNSRETSDFIVDCLQQWWEKNRQLYTQIKELVINLDNGPECSGQRTQFLKRMVEFAQQTGLRIRLVYYPPYHSKYNSIEHCWGVLENHWNGTLLSSIPTTLYWAQSMTWKGMHPTILLNQENYEKGVSLKKKEMQPYLKNIVRSETLPKWDITISPKCEGDIYF